MENYSENNAWAGNVAERDLQVIKSAQATLMRSVYLWMTLALAITGFASFVVASSPMLLQAVFGNRLVFWGLIIAEFALVVMLSARIHKMTAPTATMMFIVYSLLNGVVLSSIFLLYTAQSIANVFFITAGTFGVMSVYGMVTKSDLSKIGNICFMALIGIIIATVVNMFLKSEGMMLVISYIGVLIFVGLTAYDTWKIKNDIRQYGTEVNDMTQKLALMGALSLYLDFVNLFLYLLRIFGNRK